MSRHKRTLTDHMEEELLAAPLQDVRDFAEHVQMILRMREMQNKRSIRSANTSPIQHDLDDIDNDGQREKP